MCRKKVILVSVLLIVWACSRAEVESAEDIPLPAPRLKGTISLEEAIKARRSVRSYSAKALSLEQVSQILWAGQGITDERGFKRAAPSAGALYPLELYLAVKDGGVKGLSGGVYHYIAQEHKLELVKKSDENSALARAALGQMWMAKAPVMMVLACEYPRTMRKYGQRGIRYVHIETGLAAENILLQAEALGLCTCPVGAFQDEEAGGVINLSATGQPLLILTIGYK
jgi:SagB-type dehydrogenase family enzyme